MDLVLGNEVLDLSQQADIFLMFIMSGELNQLLAEMLINSAFLEILD
jgi:hypothetical protein